MEDNVRCDCARGVGARAASPSRHTLLAPACRAVAQQEINDTRFSEKEHAQLEHGYYEDLTNVNSMNSKLWHLLLGKPNGRPDVRDMPVMRVRDDYLDFDFAPNKSAQWFGATYAINRWGMRDKDMTSPKPAGAFRICMLIIARVRMGVGLPTSGSRPARKPPG